jgi:prephenate dehydrogenase
MAQEKISVIGLGLIGGSLVKTIRKANPEIFISAFDKPSVLVSAKNDSVIDEGLSTIEGSLNSDIIFICLPVDESLKIFSSLIPKLKKNQIITDVCSVKKVFDDIWNKSGSEGIYIGGHPMTGKEKGGYENSDSLLFENSVYILTMNNPESVGSNRLSDLIHSLGARVTFLDPKVHDIIVASVSHLPQLVSVSLINATGLKDSGINFFDYAAGGFRDMTRIASSDFNIWEPIIRNNGRNIIQAIDNFIYRLDQIKKLVEKEDYKAIAAKFESARIKRDEIPKSNKGFIHQLYDVFVFVKDQPGEISKISTALFENNINIKDMELLKIREGTGGTFRLSFDNEPDSKIAKKVIEDIGFSTKL